jgi:hypothetical protein
VRQARTWWLMTGKWFRGGMSLEVRFYGARRLNATMPLARLQVSDGGIWLGTTTITMPRDLSSVQYERAEVAQVFKSRGLLTRGVGIATTDGKTHYFWAWRVAKVLNAFSVAGYLVGAPRRPKLWRLFLDQMPWPWRRPLEPRAAEHSGADRAGIDPQHEPGSWRAGRPHGPAATRLSGFAAWRSRSRVCACLDWLVGAAGLALTVVPLCDSVVSWPRNTVLLYPGALERLAGVLLLPSWAWVLTSWWMVAGTPSRGRRTVRSPRRQTWGRLGVIWKRTLRPLAAAGLVVLAVVVVGFVLGAAKGSLRVLPDGVHQVSTPDLNSAKWTTVTPAGYNRWAARFVREDAMFGFFGIITVGFSPLVHNLRRSVRRRDRTIGER